MNVLFVNAWALFFLWLVPAVGLWWYLVHRRRTKDLDRFVSPAMQKKLSPARSSAKTAWQSALALAGLFLLLVAAARPQWGAQEITVYQRGRDLMILLDVSRSMLADDVHPNRLQRAKTDILDLIKELKGDRAGLMAFRFKAILLCPLTTDYAFIRHALDAADIGAAPRGETDIGDAIAKALDAFDEREGAHKAIILISDGEDLSGRALEAAKKAGEKGVPIFTVGLGSAQGAKIPKNEAGASGFVAHQGQDVVTKMDNAALLAIAEASKGAHISIGTASTSTMTLGALYRSFRQKIAEQENEETMQRRRIERYQLFLLPAVILLLAGAFLSRGRLAFSSRPAAPALATESATTPPPLKDINPPRQPPKSIATLLFSLALAPAGLHPLPDLRPESAAHRENARQLLRNQ
ncbi:MAG: VWA domain-containing protein [Verrucomicrobiota bacterium]|nr:VWA domain-containing protein [Verrucomicrobiota bacterium]